MSLSLRPGTLCLTRNCESGKNNGLVVIVLKHVGLFPPARWLSCYLIESVSDRPFPETRRYNDDGTSYLVQLAETRCIARRSQLTPILDPGLDLAYVGRDEVEHKAEVLLQAAKAKTIECPTCHQIELLVIQEGVKRAGQCRGCGFILLEEVRR